MTLVRTRQREVVLERERSDSLTFVKYLLPSFFLALLILGTFILNAKTSQLSFELNQFRRNLSSVQQQEEVLDIQIKKLFIGRDVIN